MCPWWKIPMLDNLRHNKYRLPLCWYSLFKTSAWMSRSEFVWLFGFRYAFPCLGWMQVLPLPYSQIRLINWSNLWTHFDIREQDCNSRIFENIHWCISCTSLYLFLFKMERNHTLWLLCLHEVWVKHERNLVQCLSQDCLEGGPLVLF